jgi:hypothetical protein
LAGGKWAKIENVASILIFAAAAELAVVGLFAAAKAMTYFLA